MMHLNATDEPGRKPPLGFVEALGKALGDAAPDVRIEAAEALARHGETGQALPILAALLRHESEWVRLRAACAIDNLDEKARPLIEDLKAATKDKNAYVADVARHALSELK
jgi:HEAT repeat protein